ncbi:ABC transporter permease DevC [Kamptonema formosum]|uniref:ABC transporter permease DevC n=1 Tax=Kamptonema formosum TaxID=331992 RepID=UPI0018E24981|nr:ABC transporter permease DevC [Oscillatoria sp. PCC 10802]
MKTPLAWLQLTREKMRLLVALAGIGFADILMFMQLGFRDALFESSVRLHRELQGDIFLISPQSTALIAMKSFPHRRLYQALIFEGVESVSPVYLNFALWKNPYAKEQEKECRGENQKLSPEDQDKKCKKATSRGILVVGFNPSDPVFDLPAVVENIDKIKLSDVVLFDEASRAEFGPIPEKFNQGETVTTEVGGRRVKVKGLFTLGASFGADGNIITSDLNFLRIFNRSNKGLIDVGIVKLKPGVDVRETVQRMRALLPGDVKIFSKEEFLNWEISYWQNSTAIGFIFSLGTAMGFIVGIVIVYQILYTDVTDHLAEYATLKAMGYTDTYFLVVVFQEALVLAILGYFPAMGLSFGLYHLTKNATSLPVMMTAGRAVVVFILTVLMCSISGAIAVRKLSAADPADIF